MRSFIIAGLAVLSSFATPGYASVYGRDIQVRDPEDSYIEERDFQGHAGNQMRSLGVLEHSYLQARDVYLQARDDLVQRRGYEDLYARDYKPQEIYRRSEIDELRSVAEQIPENYKGETIKFDAGPTPLPVVETTRYKLLGQAVGREYISINMHMVVVNEMKKLADKGLGHDTIYRGVKFKFIPGNVSKRAPVIQMLSTL